MTDARVEAAIRVACTASDNHLKCTFPDCSCRNTPQMIRAAIEHVDAAALASADGVVRELSQALDAWRSLAGRNAELRDKYKAAFDVCLFAQQAAATIQALSSRVAALEACMRYGVECRIVEDGREKGWRISAGSAVGKPDLWRWVEKARALLADAPAGERK